MCERRINLPFVSGNALIYEIHMVTQPRPQPPQIPQACWRLRLEPGGGSTLAQHTSFIHSLTGLLGTRGGGVNMAGTLEPAADPTLAGFSSSCNLALIFLGNCQGCYVRH